MHGKQQQLIFMKQKVILCMYKVVTLENIFLETVAAADTIT